MDHLVLTIIAADKPGLVERIAQNIAAHGGNWLESRMAHMAGQFAGILRVSVPAENRQALVGALEDLSTHGIRVLVGEGSTGQAFTSKPIVMTLVGNDRSGIVREITALLSKQGVNLESLSTDVRPARCAIACLQWRPHQTPRTSSLAGCPPGGAAPARPHWCS